MLTSCAGGSGFIAAHILDILLQNGYALPMSWRIILLLYIHIIPLRLLTRSGNIAELTR